MFDAKGSDNFTLPEIHTIILIKKYIRLTPTISLINMHYQQNISFVKLNDSVELPETHWTLRRESFFVHCGWERGGGVVSNFTHFE